MPRLESFELRIKTGTRPGPKQPGYAINGFMVEFDERKGGTEPGEVLDGEGGYTVWGRLMVAGDSLGLGAVPIGLAHGLILKAPVRKGDVVKWSDVDVAAQESSLAFQVRREMEARMTPLTHKTGNTAKARAASG